MSEILINAKASGFPPAISSNGGPDFVVLWNTASNTTIKGQILSASGVKDGDEFAVNAPTGGTHRLPAVAGLAGFLPGFVVAWIADGPPAGVLLQRFDPNGKKSGEEVRVNTTPVNPAHRPVVLRLVTGNVVVSWVSASLEEGIRAQVFRPDGTRAGGEFPVQTSGGVHFAPVGTLLENAGFVIGWEGGPNFGSTQARFQIFQPDGSKSGPEVTPNFFAFRGDMAMTFISNSDPSAEPGHFVIAHVSRAGGSEEQLVIASLFGPDGALKGSANVTHRDDQTIGSRPALRALPGQRCVVVWTEMKVPHVGDRSLENVKARILIEEMVISQADDGSFTADHFLRDHTSDIEVHPPVAEGGNQFSPCVATIVNELGEFVAIAWVDDSVSGSDSSFRAVKARVLTSGLSDPV